MAGLIAFDHLVMPRITSKVFTFLALRGTQDYQKT
jgi:hypothetical protein